MPKLDINNNEYLPPPPLLFKKGRKRVVCFPPTSELEKELAPPDSSADMIDCVSHQTSLKHGYFRDDDSIPATTASSFVSHTDTVSIIDSQITGDGPGPVFRPTMVIPKTQRHPQGKALEIKDTNSNLIEVNEPISSEGFSRTPPSPTRPPTEEEVEEKPVERIKKNKTKKSEPKVVLHEEDDDDLEELDLRPEKSMGRKIRREIWARIGVGRSRTPMIQPQSRRKPRFASQVEKPRRPYMPRSKSVVSESVSGAVSTGAPSTNGSVLSSAPNSRVWSVAPNGVMYQMPKNYPNTTTHQNMDDEHNNNQYPKNEALALKKAPPSSSANYGMDPYSNKVRNMYGPSYPSVRERKNTYPHLKSVLQELKDTGALFDRLTAVEALKARILRGDKVTHEEIKAIRHMTLPPHQRHLGWRLPWSKDLCCIKGLVHIPTPNKPAPERNTFGTLEDLRLPRDPHEVTEEHWGRRQYVVNLAGFEDDDISLYLEGKDRLVIRAIRPDARDDLPATTVTETIVLPPDLPADNLRIVRRPSGTTIIEESWRF